MGFGRVSTPPWSPLTGGTVRARGGAPSAFCLTPAALGSYNESAKSDGYGGGGNAHVSRVVSDENVGTIMSSL